MFPILIAVADFFGFFQAIVAQASSEASFARVLGAEARDFMRFEAARGDVFLGAAGRGPN